jgi:hypothetical protein
MEPNGSSPCSQQPQSVSFLSKISTVHARPYYFFIPFNSTTPSTLTFPSAIFISVLPTIYISNIRIIYVTNFTLILFCKGSSICQWRRSAKVQAHSFLTSGPYGRDRVSWPLCRDADTHWWGAGGGGGRRGDGDAIENRKISCPCRESNSDAHVSPSVWQSINACTGWFPVHTSVGITNNAMTTCRLAWHISEYLALQRRKPAAPPSLQFKGLLSVASLYLYLRQNTAVWRIRVYRSRQLHDSHLIIFLGPLNHNHLHLPPFSARA